MGKTDKIPEELGHLNVASMLWREYGVPPDLSLADVLYAVELERAKNQRAERKPK